MRFSIAVASDSVLYLVYIKKCELVNLNVIFTVMLDPFSCYKHKIEPTTIVCTSY